MTQRDKGGVKGQDKGGVKLIVHSQSPDSIARVQNPESSPAVASEGDGRAAVFQIVEAFDESIVMAFGEKHRRKNALPRDYETVHAWLEERADIPIEVVVNICRYVFVDRHVKFVLHHEKRSNLVSRFDGDVRALLDMYKNELWMSAPLFKKRSTMERLYEIAHSAHEDPWQKRLTK